jgi:hypothetical protein
MKKYSHFLFFSITIFLIFGGCSRKIYQVAYPTLSDGRYDTEFPYKSCAKELEKISQTIRKLSCIAYYRSYVFKPEAEITIDQVRDNDYKNYIFKEIYYNNSVIGTATVIYYMRRHIVLLTCAHIVDFPDTVYTYYYDENQGKSLFIQSVSFKIKQNNFVADLPERGNLEILAMDGKTDIAVLGRVFWEDINYQIPVFEYPFGKANDLEWGSFVYLMGYPKGHKMVTRGIVSQPNRGGYGAFIVDGLFNRGFSGGIVLAIKDGVPNFELVGIASSTAADIFQYLAPPENLNKYGYSAHVPYEGDIHVKLEKQVNYGITFVVPSEQICDFMRENLDIFRDKGFNMSFLID